MSAHRQRITYLPILTAVVVLAIAVPGTALAKGPTDARVEGPLLAEPLSLDWESDEHGLNSLIEATGFWELTNPPTAAMVKGELGPRYVVSYTVYAASGDPTPFSVHTYPFATPTPMIYVPGGQIAFPLGEVSEGWRTASAGLTAWFEERGLAPDAKAAAKEAPPPAATETAPVQPASSSTPAGSEPSWLPVIVTTGALAAIGLLIIALRRRARVAAA